MRTTPQKQGVQAICVRIMKFLYPGWARAANPPALHLLFDEEDEPQGQDANHAYDHADEHQMLPDPRGKGG